MNSSRPSISSSATNCFCFPLSSPSSSANQGNNLPCTVNQNCDSVSAKKDIVMFPSSSLIVLSNVILQTNDTSPCLFFFSKSYSSSEFCKRLFSYKRVSPNGEWANRPSLESTSS